MKRAVLALTLAFAGTMVAASPAQAAPPPAVPILSAACDGFLYPDTTAMAQGANGRVHGFANYAHSTDCGDKIFYFEGSGTSWRSSATSLRGTVVDVAQDTTGTYLLYVLRELSETAELAIAKRAPDGTFTRLAIVAPVTGDSGHDKGSIIARGGKWLAVWQQESSPGNYDLYQYGPLYAATASGVQPVPIGGTANNDTSPALTIAPDGTTVLAFKRGAIGSTKIVRVARTTTGSTYSWQTAASGVPIDDYFPGLDVVATTAGTFVAWSGSVGGGRQVVVADNLTGRWRTQTDLPAFLGSSWDPSLAAVGSRVMAGYGSGDEFPSDGLDFARRTTAAGAWTAVPYGTGVAPSIDSRGVVGMSVHNNSVTAVVFSGDTLYAVTGLPL
ncbi:MAG TPA: hypothetical protein VF755_15880 [Catenuloplanes sp.]|jgi:hypothetical protein